MADIQNPQIKSLFDFVQQGYSMPIHIKIEGPASGTLKHQFSQQTLQKDGSLLVTVSDITNVDYTLSHELLHMQQAVAGFPQLHFHLTTGDEILDGQYSATASALYDAVAHALIVSWQRTHDLINKDVEAAVVKGFAEDVPEETAGTEDMLIFRVLSLFDLMVFFQGGSQAQQKAWQQRFPKAYAPASKLLATLTQRLPKDPYEFRRAVVALFKQFNELLDQLGYQLVEIDDYATVPPVLSEHQLRLAVNQVYQFKHSQWRNRQDKNRGYIGLGNDTQNAFVLPLQEKQATSALFQKLYQMPLGELLAHYHVEFSRR